MSTAALRLVPPAAPPAPTLRRFFGQASTREGRIVFVTRWAAHSVDVLTELMDQAGPDAQISVQPVAALEAA